MASVASSSMQGTSESGVRPKKQPIVIITIGMAGSGKTTFVQRINAHLHQHNLPPYIVNLDPAVTHVPFDANIDIRDTINYEEVMKQYNLGPNGGILTSLNLFTTKFDQVLNLIEKRAENLDYVILDTPGQIEIFTWSASGAIITDAIASSFPTVVAYIIDTPRTMAPATFMSNMLYACSILYKTRLPFILVFNKTDAKPHGFALEWMKDFESFQQALTERGSQIDGPNGNGEPTYMDSLMTSMSLVLDEFYRHLTAVGVSSVTGDGIADFFTAVDNARTEYENEYRPENERLMKQREEALKVHQEATMTKLMKDLKVKEPWQGPGRDPREDPWPETGPHEEEEDSGEEIDRNEDPGPFLNIDHARRDAFGDGFIWPRPS